MADEFGPPENTTESADPEYVPSEAARQADIAAQLRGDSAMQRQMDQKLIYDATDNPNNRGEGKRQAQRNLAATEKERKWRFDWAQWRAEKAKRGDKTP